MKLGVTYWTHGLSITQTKIGKGGWRKSRRDIHQHPTLG